jgi:hypothetical protein
MMKRRLTTAAAAMHTTIGAFAAINCETMSWAMPEKERIESAMPSIAESPAALAATPATKPKGIVPMSTGRYRARRRGIRRGSWEGRF